MRFWAFHMMFVVVPSLIFMTYAQFQVGQVDKAEAQMNKLLEHGKEDESGKYQHRTLWTVQSSPETVQGFGLHKNLLYLTIIFSLYFIGLHSAS